MARVSTVEPLRSNPAVVVGLNENSYRIEGGPVPRFMKRTAAPRNRRNGWFVGQNNLMTTAWSFLTLDAAARQFVGNAGYEDDLERHYSWDATVPNHGRVSAGDLAVLRDGEFVLGVAWIDRIKEWKGEKDRFRCPSCERTGFKQRLTMTPRYKCASCSSEFAQPTVERLTDLSFFRADYARTWRPLDHPLPISGAAAAYRKNAQQHAIREMDIAVVRSVLDTPDSPGTAWWSAVEPGGMDIGGGHRIVLGKVRIGQQRFREEMLARFGSNCAICGPLPPAALEAAHLYRFADQPQHRLDGGLLLRRDLHALFDRYLLLIDPDDEWRVHMAPGLHAYPDLRALAGRKVNVRSEQLPSDQYLRDHAAFCRACW